MTKFNYLSYNYTILYIFVSLLLFWLIVKWFVYLLQNNYINENFDINSPFYSHSVDLPINTTYSCLNFCGPNASCAITGEQCLADIDCSGCKLPILTTKEPINFQQVNPYFDSGNLTYNLNPQYSKLTSDIGSRASIYDSNSTDKQIPKMYLGIDKWSKSFNYGMQLSDDKLAYQYSATSEPYKFSPKYPITESATGLFYDMGPTASNADLITKPHLASNADLTK
jgi:hypothetical protein